MPNWCHSVITISGPTDKMEKFYDVIKEGDNYYLTFAKTVPVPKLLVPRDIWGGTTTEWGTKWDINPPKSTDYSDTEYEILDCLNDKYRIRCNTAWCAPIKWAKSASNKFQLNIKIAYVEQGCGVYGLFNVDFETKSIHQSEYKFLEDDLIITEADYSDDDLNMIDHINGRLKTFIIDNDMKELGG